MIKRVLPAIVVAFVVAAPFAGRAANAAVSISGFAFVPADVTVTPGSTVTWTNMDDASHTVTADGGEFTSGALAKDGTYSRTFASAGTFAYHCSIHTSMTGVVRVRAPSASPTPSASAKKSATPTPKPSSPQARTPSPTPAASKSPPATPTPSARTSATPSLSPSDSPLAAAPVPRAPSRGAPRWPWAAGGLLVLAAAGGLVYLRFIKPG